MIRRGSAGHTGLGGGAKEKMSGQTSGDKQRDDLINACSQDFYKLFLEGGKMDEGYCDAGFDNNEIRVGIEPTYQYQYLKMIVIPENIQDSYLVIGWAASAWASKILCNHYYYRDYVRYGKVKRFIKKWHTVFYPIEQPLFKDLV